MDQPRRKARRRRRKQSGFKVVEVPCHSASSENSSSSAGDDDISPAELEAAISSSDALLSLNSKSFDEQLKIAKSVIKSLNKNQIASKCLNALISKREHEMKHNVSSNLKSNEQNPGPSSSANSNRETAVIKGNSIERMNLKTSPESINVAKTKNEDDKCLNRIRNLKKKMKQNKQLQLYLHCTRKINSLRSRLRSQKLINNYLKLKIKYKEEIRLKALKEMNELKDKLYAEIGELKSTIEMKEAFHAQNVETARNAAVIKFGEVSSLVKQVFQADNRDTQF